MVADTEDLATGALDWLLQSTPDDAELDPTLYSGAAGIVLTLLEAQQHFGDDRYADAALIGSESITAVG